MEMILAHHMMGTKERSRLINSYSGMYYSPSKVGEVGVSCYNFVECEMIQLSKVIAVQLQGATARP